MVRTVASVRIKALEVDMAITKRSIAVQTSMIDARLAAVKRSGSQEAFRLQLASIGEALSANASVDVALEFLRESKKPSQPSTLTCAIMDAAIYKPINKARVSR